MAVFRQRPFGEQQLADLQFQHDLQGLFPAPHRAGKRRRRQPCRFFHLFCRSGRPDDLVPVRTDLANRHGAALFVAGAPRFARFSLWLSALNVKYRDFRYIVPFIVQFGLYVSPVGFSSNVVPEKWRLLYSLNPMVGVIDGFRWAILGGETQIYMPGFLLSTGLTFLILYGGVGYFRKTERIFADII